MFQLTPQSIWFHPLWPQSVSRNYSLVTCPLICLLSQLYWLCTLSFLQISTYRHHVTSAQTENMTQVTLYSCCSCQWGKQLPQHENSTKYLHCRSYCRLYRHKKTERKHKICHFSVITSHCNAIPLHQPWSWHIISGSCLSSAAESHVYTSFHANQTAAALLSKFTLTEGLLISQISWCSV